MIVRWRPGDYPTAWSSGRGRPYFAAGISLMLIAAVMAAWAAIGWAHVAQFDGAAERMFNTPAFADDDLAVAGVELPNAAALITASVLAIITAVIGWAVLDRWQRSRTAAIILGLGLTIFSIKVLLLDFIAGIEVPDTGISDHLDWQSVRQFNDLTSWRLASWFHVYTGASGIISIMLAVASCYLLRKSGRTYHPAYVLGQSRYR
jgi:hypothetical protein